MQYFQFKASLISYVGATGHKYKYFFRMIRKIILLIKRRSFKSPAKKRLVSVQEIISHSLVSANEL